MSQQNRSWRRHHRWRMVQRALRLFRMWDSGPNNPRDERGLHVKRRPHDPEKFADNLTICSCLACRNPHSDDWHRRKERATDAGEAP